MALFSSKIPPIFCQKRVNEYVNIKLQSIQKVYFLSTFNNTTFYQVNISRKVLIKSVKTNRTSI